MIQNKNDSNTVSFIAYAFKMNKLHKYVLIFMIEGEVKIMNFYSDLVSFLNCLNDFFIEVEGKPDQLKKFIAEYNAQTGAGITMNSDGIRTLDPNVDKWGLEFRLYTNERPKPLLGNEFHANRTYRPEYSYRLSDNSLVKPLLFNGFYLGRN